MNKKKRNAMIVLIGVICIATISLILTPTIAGYTYFPSFKEKLVISPPVAYQDAFEPIVLTDKNQIEEFKELFQSENLELDYNAKAIFSGERDNDNNLYLSIGLFTEFPERILGWEYVVSSSDSYISPTQNKDKEVYLVSAEAASFLENHLKYYWSEMDVTDATK